MIVASLAIWWWWWWWGSIVKLELQIGQEFEDSRYLQASRK